jgi:hypothetical protein
VARAHFCSILLTASTNERIPLLQYTGPLRNEGCPTRRVYAWGFVPYRHNRSRQRIKTANNQIKSPTRKPVVWATQFISSFGGWLRLTFFLLDGAHRGEDTTVVIHRIIKKRGCPTRRFYAWEVCILPSRSIRSADKNWEQRDQKPHA